MYLNLEILILLSRIVPFLAVMVMLWVVLIKERGGDQYYSRVLWKLAIALYLSNLIYGRTKVILGISSHGLLETSVILTVNIAAGVCVLLALYSSWNLAHE